VTIVSSLERAKEWWQAYTGEEDAPFDDDTPAWAVSLVLHVAVLLSMALIGLPEPPAKPRPIPIVSTPPVETDVLMEPPEELTVSVDPQPEAGAQSDAAVEVAQSMAPVVAEESIVPVVVEADPAADITLEPVEADATGLVLTADIAVKGAVGVGTTGASGAVDRLTVEIAAALEQRPTLVCWLFDQSVSLAAQR
jgi:hypothetical protein